MSARDDLLPAVGEFEALMSHSAGLNADVADHRKEAIQIRRQIAEKFAALSSAGADVFPDHATEVAFRNAFSKMRSATSYHQASWPVVAVDYNSPDYRASEHRVRRSCQEFIKWNRATLGSP